MKKNSLITGIFVGVTTSLPVIAITLASAWLLHLPPFPLDIFDWLARVLPGRLIGFGIDSMVAVIRFLHLGPTASTAKLAEQIMGLLTLVVIGAIFGGFVAFVGRRSPKNQQEFALAGGLVIALFTMLVEYYQNFASGVLATVIWSALLFMLWGVVLSQLLNPALPIRVPRIVQQEGAPQAPVNLTTGEALTSPPAEASTQTSPELALASMNRREFIYLGAAAAAAVVVSAVGLNKLRSNSATASLPPSNPPASLDALPTPTLVPPYPTLAPRIQLAPGTRPEITSTANFYRIDINLIPPSIDPATYRFVLDGLVENQLSLTLDEIRSHPSVTQPLTMQCISNPVGGDLTGTTVWTGVPLKDILAIAGPKSNVASFKMTAQDSFYEYISISSAMDPRTLLVYEMNGEPLPVEHGFPLRIYIPNRYGMKQPKWLTHMEAVDEEGDGFWVARGWDINAFVKTTSVIDTVAVQNMDPATRLVPVGGIAWAGDRGISKVEVQVDNGPWMEAQLNNPPLSGLTWVQWRYDWPAQSGNHRFSVRAYNGNGVLQETKPLPPEPSGATGIHSIVAQGPS